MEKSTLMRVLQLNEWTKPAGGVEIYIAQLQKIFPNYNVKSFWVGIHSYDGDYTVTIAGDSAVTKYNSSQQVVQYIGAFLEEEQIDIICIHNIFDIELIEFCLSVKPVIKFAHSPVMVCPGREKFWRFTNRICEKKVGLHCFYHIYKEGCANRHPKRVKNSWEYVKYEIEKASRVYKKIIVMSAYISKGLEEVGIDGGKIACIPYFTEEVGSTSGNLDKPRKLLFIGRLAESKGVMQMLSAVIPILKTESDVILEIVGDGIQRKELEEVVKENKLTEKVLFSGWLSRNEIFGALNGCYLLIFPSIYPEAFGIVGIEAMMHAKPVVAFNVGGVSTWLKDGESGLLIENGDIEGLQKGIKILLQDNLLYERLCINAREKALTDFLPANHLQKLLNQYRSALQ